MSPEPVKKRILRIVTIAIWGGIFFALAFRMYQAPMEGALGVQFAYGAIASFISLFFSAFLLREKSSLMSLLLLLLISFVWYAMTPPAPIGFHWSIEARGHLKEIIKAEEEYFDKHASFLAVGPWPEKLHGNKPSLWKSGTNHTSSFDALKWFPGGYTYCQYAVGANKDAYIVEVVCDFGPKSEYGGAIGYVKSSSKGNKAVPPIGRCSGKGVYSRSGEVLNSIGACDAESEKGMLIRIN